MSLYIKNIGSQKFRVMLHNGTTEDLESAGALPDGRPTFWLNGKTPLECFDPTKGHGNRLIAKGHRRDVERNEVLNQTCRVCGKKVRTYKG